jgi:hypothetical protein
MGKQTNIKLSGTFENVIYYERMGEFYMREKPPKVKRVPVAIMNSGIFGKSANYSGILRELLAPILPVPGSRPIMYRVNKAFGNWLRSDPFIHPDPIDAIPAFTRLSLHPQNELRQFFKVPTSVNRNAKGQLQLHLSAFDPVLQIQAPAGTTKVQMQIAVAAMPIEGSTSKGFITTNFLFDFTPGILAARNIDLPIDTSAGRLLIVSCSLQYFASNVLVVNQQTWKPAGIVESFYN